MTPRPDATLARPAPDIDGRRRLRARRERMLDLAVGLGLTVLIVWLVLFVVAHAALAAEPVVGCTDGPGNPLHLSAQVRLNGPVAGNYRNFFLSGSVDSGTCDGATTGGHATTRAKIHLTFHTGAVGTDPGAPTAVFAMLYLDDTLGTGLCGEVGSGTTGESTIGLAPLDNSSATFYFTHGGDENASSPTHDSGFGVARICLGVREVIGGVTIYRFDSDSFASSVLPAGDSLQGRRSDFIQVGANLDSDHYQDAGAVTRNPFAFPDVVTARMTFNASTWQGLGGFIGSLQASLSPSCGTSISNTLTFPGTVRSQNSSFDLDNRFAARTVACTGFYNVTSASNTVPSVLWTRYTGASNGLALTDPFHATHANAFTANSALQLSSTATPPADRKATIAALPSGKRENRGFAISATFAAMNARNETVDCASSTASLMASAGTIDVQDSTLTPSAHIYGPLARTIATGDPATHDPAGNPWTIRLTPGTTAPCFPSGNPVASSIPQLNVTSLLPANSLPHAKFAQNAKCATMTNASLYTMSVDTGQACERPQGANGEAEPFNGATVTCNFAWRDPNSVTHEPQTGTVAAGGNQANFCGPFTWTPSLSTGQGPATLSFTYFDQLGNSGGQNLTVTLTSPDISTFLLTTEEGNVTAFQSKVQFDIHFLTQSTTTFTWLDHGPDAPGDCHWFIHGYDLARNRATNWTTPAPCDATGDPAHYTANWTNLPANRTNGKTRFELVFWGNMSGHLLHGNKEIVFPSNYTGNFTVISAMGNLAIATSLDQWIVPLIWGVAMIVCFARAAYAPAFAAILALVDAITPPSVGTGYGFRWEILLFLLAYLAHAFLWGEFIPERARFWRRRGNDEGNRP